MSEIKNYIKNQSCQINLDDGTKILLSLGQGDIKLFELGFLSIPKKTIYTFDIASIDVLFVGMEDILKNNTLKDISEELVGISRKEDIVECCKEVEKYISRLYPPLK